MIMAAIVAKVGFVIRWGDFYRRGANGRLL
jgi:hypothetical protein